MGTEVLERARRWGVLCMAAAMLACSERSEPATEPTRTDHAASMSTATDIELTRRLSALGYLDYVDDAGEAEPAGVTRWQRHGTDAGYSLYVVRKACKAVLIDMAGTVVQSWEAGRANCAAWDNAELLEDGMLVVPQVPIGLRRYTFDGGHRGLIRLPAHHDVTTNPARHLITLTRTFRVIPEVHPTIKTADDEITIVTRAGRVLDRLSLWDLFAMNPEQELLDVKPTRPKGSAPGIVDLFHANSVEWMERPELASRNPLYALDNVLVSIRNQDLVIIVNWPQKRIVWAWGRDRLSKQHDASVLDDGHVLIFDNGRARKRSRVVEVDPLRSEIVWEYDGAPAATFFTPGMGSAQRLANGNTLFAISNSAVFREVTPNGQIAWEYRSPHMVRGKRGTVVRVRRYPRPMIERLLAQPR